MPLKDFLADLLGLSNRWGLHAPALALALVLPLVAVVAAEWRMRRTR